jgi:hypothetical protein
MPLRQRILALIESQPGISVAELRRRLRGHSAGQVYGTMHALRGEGLIERLAGYRYRIPQGPIGAAVYRPSTIGNGFIKPVPLERLMAGH